MISSTQNILCKFIKYDFYESVYFLRDKYFQWVKYL